MKDTQTRFKCHEGPLNFHSGTKKVQIWQHQASVTSGCGMNG